MSKQAIGVIGLGVMGSNLALNMERNGFSVTVYNRTYEKTEDFIKGPAKGKKFVGVRDLKEFVESLEEPRRILIMVKAGRPVDAVMEELRPMLSRGDVLIDGGNSLFRDTDRREEEMKNHGLQFVGMGVSGGEEGALWGPSLMPGGDDAAYNRLEPILTKIAAKSDSGPCVTHIGQRGAGHFVKMVHNGIEYGDMQLIAEAYDMLRHVGGLEPPELKEVFEEWNRGDLSSFLIEVTAKVVNHPDDKGTGAALIDMIQDRAGQKGTGKWTTQEAMELAVPIPTITAAVDARFMSALKEERVKAAKKLKGPRGRKIKDRKKFVEEVRAALYASKICSYAQGMAMLRAADAAYGYGLKLGEIARIWKAGCIIRAVFLDKIYAAYQKSSKLPNLLMDREFTKAVKERQKAWRSVVKLATASGLAIPAMSASLAYFDSYRRERLPANLIQAQRDFFGAHTYERVDREGIFHTEWNS